MFTDSKREKLKHASLPIFALQAGWKDDAFEAAQEVGQIKTQNAPRRPKGGPELWFGILNETRGVMHSADNH